MSHAERAKVTGEEEGRRGAQWGQPEQSPPGQDEADPISGEGGPGAGWWATGELGAGLILLYFAASAGLETLSRGRQRACGRGVLPRWEGVSPPGLSVRRRPGRLVTQAQERAEFRGLSDHPTPTPDRAIGACPLQRLSGGAQN